MVAATGSRRWLAIGTGIGIEPVGSDLRVTAVKVRPSGVRVLGYHVVENALGRPASEWGVEFAAFARQVGARGVPVWLMLPRQEVIVRHLMLPGVGEKDLAAAVGYQIDALHPYAEDEVAFTYARLGKSHAVLVGITRREVVDRFANLLSEAGLRMAGISFSAAALYSASRILVSPPDTLLAINSDGGVLEAYGESPARPLFSGTFDMPEERVRHLVAAELRCDVEPPVTGFADLLPPFHALEGFPREQAALSLAAAISSACGRLSLPANLLTEDRRTQTSRLVYIPTLVLSVLLVVAASLLASQDAYQDRALVRRLQQEIHAAEKQAAMARQLDQQAQGGQERIALIDRYRLRTTSDIDSLKDITSILAPPAWLRSLTLSRTEAYLNGEGENVAPLLKVFDESPRFVNSTFAQALARVGAGTTEMFTIKAAREGPGAGVEQGEQR